jgi:hypothetical protein
MSADSWRWFGRAGHFICSPDCLFHMHTHVGGYCISTVGEMRRYNGQTGERDPMKEVGLDRFYETMVFRLGSDDAPSDWGEIDSDAYNEHDDALAGHMAMCRKYDGYMDGAGDEFMPWLESSS